MKYRIKVSAYSNDGVLSFITHYKNKKHTTFVESGELIWGSSKGKKIWTHTFDIPQECVYEVVEIEPELKPNKKCDYENGSWCDAPKYNRCKYRQRLTDGTHICELMT